MSGFVFDGGVLSGGDRPTDRATDRPTDRATRVLPPPSSIETRCQLRSILGERESSTGASSSRLRRVSCAPRRYNNDVPMVTFYSSSRDGRRRSKTFNSFSSMLDLAERFERAHDGT